MGGLIALIVIGLIGLASWVAYKQLRKYRVFVTGRGNLFHIEVGRLGDYNKVTVGAVNMKGPDRSYRKPNEIKQDLEDAKKMAQMHADILNNKIGKIT